MIGNEKIVPANSALYIYRFWQPRCVTSEKIPEQNITSSNKALRFRYFTHSYDLCLSQIKCTQKVSLYLSYRILCLLNLTILAFQLGMDTNEPQSKS